MGCDGAVFVFYAGVLIALSWFSFALGRKSRRDEEWHEAGRRRLEADLAAFEDADDELRAKREELELRLRPVRKP